MYKNQLNVISDDTKKALLCPFSTLWYILCLIIQHVYIGPNLACCSKSRIFLRFFLFLAVDMAKLHTTQTLIQYL